MNFQVKRNDGKLMSYKLIGHSVIPVEVRIYELILNLQKLVDYEIYFTFRLFKGSCGKDSTLLHDGVSLYLYLRVNSLYISL